MIIDKKNSSMFTNNLSSKQFNIKVNTKAFELLSDTLYSNKILAIIRELSCNAWDAHIEANNTDTPIEIYCPNEAFPNFLIEDYGTGLSKEDVINMYTTYFESSKDHTNEYAGCFGLGSKTPFSYAKTFEIKSYFNNKCYSFLAFVDNENIPNISFIGETDTDRHNGMSINIPVDENDFSLFKSELMGFFSKTDIKFKIMNITNHSFKENEILNTEDESYSENHLSHLKNGGFYSNHTLFDILYNHTCYKISYNDVESYLNSLDDDYVYKKFNLVKDYFKRVFKNIYFDDLLIKFPTGSLDVVISREKIKFTPRTCECILSFIAKIITIVDLKREIILNKIKTIFDLNCFEYACRLSLDRDQELRKAICSVTQFSLNDVKIYNSYSNLSKNNELRLLYNKLNPSEDKSISRMDDKIREKFKDSFYIEPMIIRNNIKKNYEKYNYNFLLNNSNSIIYINRNPNMKFLTETIKNKILEDNILKYFCRKENVDICILYFESKDKNSDNKNISELKKYLKKRYPGNRIEDVTDSFAEISNTIKEEKRETRRINKLERENKKIVPDRTEYVHLKITSDGDIVPVKFSEMGTYTIRMYFSDNNKRRPFSKEYNFKNETGVCIINNTRNVEFSSPTEIIEKVKLFWKYNIISKDTPIYLSQSPRVNNDEIDKILRSWFKKTGMRILNRYDLFSSNGYNPRVVYFARTLYFKDREMFDKIQDPDFKLYFEVINKYYKNIATDIQYLRKFYNDYIYTEYVDTLISKFNNKYDLLENLIRDYEYANYYCKGSLNSKMSVLYLRKEMIINLINCIYNTYKSVSDNLLTQGASNDGN